MDQPFEVSLVTDVARDVLADIAPQELPIFPAASKAYFRDPGDALHHMQARDTVLGFGDSLAILLTPAVLFVLSEVVEFLLGVARKAVEDGVAHEVKAVVKSMFAKFGPEEPDALSILTKDQVRLIHGKVLVAAKSLKVPPDKAESLANAVMAQLVVPRE